MQAWPIVNTHPKLVFSLDGKFPPLAGKYPNHQGKNPHPTGKELWSENVVIKHERKCRRGTKISMRRTVCTIFWQHINYHTFLFDSIQHCILHFAVKKIAGIWHRLACLLWLVGGAVSLQIIDWLTLHSFLERRRRRWTAVLLGPKDSKS